jgi:CRISPR-associated protein Csb1
MSEGERRHDDWLRDDGEVAALTMRQWLEPVEGKDAVIFPPTYAKPERVREEDWPGYNIDRFDDGTTVCQVDSVGSQANRMEPLFMSDRYKHLVPQVVITAGARRVHLLEAGHRAADAIVRFSTLGPELHEAFRAYKEEGNAVPLATLAPTSIVFGSWDSRATQAKLPRIIRSVIRAYNVRRLTRSAQYSTIAGEILYGEADVATGGAQAELGLAHVPAVRVHGGIQVQGEIRREAILNLAALRAVAGSTDEETLQIRRYLLGLALVSLSAPSAPNLREGCELVPDSDRTAAWTLVRHDGTRTDFKLTHQQAMQFARGAAGSFGVGPDRTEAFDQALARAVMNLGENERKKLLRQGPVTAEAIAQLGKRISRAKTKALDNV